MNRKNCFKRITALLLLLVCVVSYTAIPVSAAEVTDTVTVKQTIKGNATPPVEDGAFEYRLTYLGSNGDSDGQENMDQSLWIFMEDKVKIPFTFTHAGIHTYRLDLVIPAKQPPYVVYEDTHFIIRAYVSNDGNDLKVKFTFEDEAGDKVRLVSFEHRYEVPGEDVWSSLLPHTGDRMNLPLYLGIMALSAGAIVVLFLLRRRKVQQERQAQEEAEETEPDEE